MSKCLLAQQWTLDVVDDLRKGGICGVSGDRQDMKYRNFKRLNKDGAGFTLFQVKESWEPNNGKNGSF